jgi:hypothetical protein
MQLSLLPRLFTDDRPLHFVMISGAVIMLGWAGLFLLHALTIAGVELWDGKNH